MSESSRIKFHCRLVAGGTPNVSNPENWADDDAGYPWVAIGDMSTVSTVVDTVRRVTARGVKEARLRVGPPGTLLFSMYASLGHTAFLAREAAWNQAILGIVSGPELDSRFLRYHLIGLRPNLHELARSNTQSNLNAEQVGNLPFPVIPLVEQRRIADFLDAETASIDRLVVLRRRQCASLEEMRYAQVTEILVPGALARPLKTMPWPWLSEMPEDRPLVRLGYICRLQNGLTVDGNRRPGPDDVTRPYLRVANVQAGHVERYS